MSWAKTLDFLTAEPLTFIRDTAVCLLRTQGHLFGFQFQEIDRAALLFYLGVVESALQLAVSLCSLMSLNRVPAAFPLPVMIAS